MYLATRLCGNDFAPGEACTSMLKPALAVLSCTVEEVRRLPAGGAWFGSEERVLRRAASQRCVAGFVYFEALQRFVILYCGNGGFNKAEAQVGANFV